MKSINIRTQLVNSCCMLLSIESIDSINLLHLMTTDFCILLKTYIHFGIAHYMHSVDVVALISLNFVAIAKNSFNSLDLNQAFNLIKYIFNFYLLWDSAGNKQRDIHLSIRQQRRSKHLGFYVNFFEIYFGFLPDVFAGGLLRIAKRPSDCINCQLAGTYKHT